jgi:hypothetical protein
MPTRRLLNLLCLAVALACEPATAQQQQLRNWFDDPFFSITSAVPGCPEPAGPRVSSAERGAQSHRRAEKGTTCWLANEKDCERHTAYAYDQDIASAIRHAVRSGDPFPHSSLWVTVQGRVVYVEGCSAGTTDPARIESFMRAVPHVQQAVAIIATDPTTPPPYRAFKAR